MNKFLYLLSLKKKNVILGKKTVVSKNNIFEGDNKIDSFSKISNCYFGRYSYIGENCDFREVKIGKYCSLGARITCVLGQHPTNFVSTHPFCYQKGTILKSDVEYTSAMELDDKIQKFGGYKILIKNDVRIGNNVTIFSGVTIHNGAIVGTGAVVNKDIPAYAIAVGVPARVIKYRFSEKEIEFLEKFKWWDKDIKWIKKNICLFNNISQFITEQSSKI